MIPDICIYHGGCIDGFTAAWAVWKAYPKCSFIAGAYNDKFNDIRGKNVLMVDFSVKWDQLLEMAKSANKIMVIDHHETAYKDLVLDRTDQKLPDNVALKFDMDKSGALLAWEWCHTAEPPKIIKYVSDRDLWQFKLPQSRAFHAYTSTVEQTFEAWDHVSRLLQDPHNHDNIIYAGTRIDMAHLANCRRAIDAGMHMEMFGDDNVPMLNVPYFMASDCGNMMSEGHPFSVTYYITETEIKFSLRSQKGGKNVAKVAAFFGGGGHEHAAGFSKPKYGDIQPIKVN